MGQQPLIKVEDESGERNYFTIVPNYIIDHSDAVSLALYGQLKRLTGDKGSSKCSRQYLMDKLGITKPTLLKKLDFLLEKEWIKEVEPIKVQTAGGVQNLKSYKLIDIWHLNVDFYQGGKKEAPPTPKGVKNSTDKGVNQGGKKEAHKEEPLEEEPLNKNTLPISNEIGIQEKELNKQAAEVINLFKNVNPSFKRLFVRKVEKDAAKRMIVLHGFEKVGKIIDTLQETNGIKYAPIIISPTQLENKLGQLIAFIQKERSAGNVVNKVLVL